MNITIVGSLKSNDIRNHLGSRTPYRFRSNKNDSRIKFPSKNSRTIYLILSSIIQFHQINHFQ